MDGRADFWHSWVSTDMGNAGAKAAGLDEAPVKVEDSAKGILNRIDHATREHTSGTFQDFENDQQWRW
jgi:norsolorinic acid ketoreductase